MACPTLAIPGLAAWGVTPTPRRYDVDAGRFLGVDEFRLTADAATDLQARAVVVLALQRAGARQVGTRDERPRQWPPVEVRMRTGGVVSDGASEQEPLPAGGYTLDVRADGAGVTLHGVDPAGTWNAAQTLRQLSRPAEGGAVLPAVRVRDWPQLPMRGVIEGFYGPAWSHEDRCAMLRFCGEHKMNTFVYAPKDDPYHRLHWRDPYPPDELERLAELVTVARGQHVQFVYAIAPGLSIRHSDEGDFAALVAKAEQLARCGVDAFWLLFDDIAPSLRDPADIERFGAEPSPLAAAQAHVCNRFLHEFYVRRGFSQPLVMVPVDYAGNTSTAYRRCLAEKLDPDIPVSWTGPDVIPLTIDAGDVSAAADSFDRDLVLWDNYPTNDFDPSRLFLGPVVGRARGVCSLPVRGFVANAMVQAGPSRLPLVTVADFIWNPDDYEPARAQQLALADIAGVHADALGVLADACGSSLSPDEDNRALHELTRAFWRSYDAEPAAAPYAPLLEHFESLVAAAYTVARDVRDQAFRRQSGPWQETLRLSGQAASAALRALAAHAERDDELAWQQAQQFQREARQLAEHYPAVLRDVVDPFLRRAAANLDLVAVRVARREDGALVLTLVIQPGAVPVDRVEVLDGDEIVARAVGGAASAVWEHPPEGGHTICARAVRLDGSAVTSPPVALVVGSARAALVLVGDDEEPHLGDSTLRDRLARLGFVASLGTRVPVEGPLVPDLVVVAAGADPEAVAAVRTMPVPVLACGSFMALGMAETSDIRAPAERVDIGPAGGPLGGGLPAGTATVYRGPGRLRWAAVGAQAIVGATLAGDAARACTFGYRAGAAMPGLVAPARRAGTFVSEAGLLPALLTRRGTDLFDAAVRWLFDAGS